MQNIGAVLRKIQPHESVAREIAQAQSEAELRAIVARIKTRSALVKAEGEALGHLVGARQECNPQQEALTRETARYATSRWAGALVAAIAGAFTGVLASSGDVLAGAMLNCPILIAPLAAFALSLVTQTFVYRQLIDLPQIRLFLLTAAWSAFVTFCATVVAAGILRVYQELRGKKYV